MKKKMMVAAMTVLVVLSLSMVAIAQEQQKVKGKVTKIDRVTKSVTFKTKAGSEVTIVMEDASKLSRVKEGNKGEATYVTEEGINIGSKLRKIIGDCD
jgi:Cu/Ag efflux protein CusF